VGLIGLFVFYGLWQLLPDSLRSRVQVNGHEFLLVTPVFAVSALLAMWLGPWMESVFFGGDYQRWLLERLNITYDQRNSVVVGIAMGFAVIPIIYTIAEDSLSSVPRNLRSGFTDGAARYLFRRDDRVWSSDRRDDDCTDGNG
jgi:phosphate transport system permease protein